MPTPKKEQEVALLQDKMQRASGLVFTEYVGLSANEITEMRRQLRQQGVEYRVIKNSLAELAAQRVGLEVEGLLKGPTGICFGFDDPVAPFRVANQLAKKYKQYKLNGGFFEGKKVLAGEVGKLANLPTREQALARLAAVLQAPVQKLAAALAGASRNLAVVLKEISKQKQS